MTRSDDRGAPTVARPETAVGSRFAHRAVPPVGVVQRNYALTFAADNTILAANTTVDHGSVDLP